MGLVHELCAKSGPFLVSYLPWLIPDVGKRREEDLAPALPESTFQSRRPTNACEIIREQCSEIDTSCTDAEEIQRKGKVVVWESLTRETFRRRCVLEEISDLDWQKGGDSWQGKNVSSLEGRCLCCGCRRGSYNLGFVEVGNTGGWQVAQRVLAHRWCSSKCELNKDKYRLWVAWGRVSN